MKAFLKKSLFTILFLLTPLSFAQEISFEPLNTFLYELPGTEVVFEINVTNLSAQDQTVFIVRTINNLPASWTSSLCFDLCFSSEVDSIATTDTFGSTPLSPGETRVMSLHIFTDASIATGNVQLQAGTFHNPESRITKDFIATTDPSVNVNETIQLKNYSLSQNYPNPFNPSTKINYNVAVPGFVQLKVYNVLGVEISALVSEQKYAGNYTVDFDASKLSSGVYFYSLSVNNFNQTRKMILEK
jgi:hypothetical protein